MSFGRYLNTNTVRLGCDCNNRKKVLETIANLLSTGHNKPAASEILKRLLEREKLGSTGLGHGIAVPHCRIANISAPRAAVLRLHEAIDFDTPDGVPVALFCALVVDVGATDEHLQIFANLVGFLNDKMNRNKLLQADNTDTVLSLLSIPANAH